MIVYELLIDSNDRWAVFYTKNGFVIPNYLNNKDFYENQTHVEIERTEEFNKRKIKQELADFCYGGCVSEPCFSKRAKEIFEEYIGAIGQWLRLHCEEAEYWLFRVNNVIDALEPSNSKIEYYRSGRTMAIEEFSFNENKLLGQLIFKVKECPEKYNLVTQDFVDIVTKNKLTGFLFRKVWSSEEGAVSSRLKDWERPKITGLEAVNLGT